jgi:hypothetical protein
MLDQPLSHSRNFEVVFGVFESRAEWVSVMENPKPAKKAKVSTERLIAFSL